MIDYLQELKGSWQMFRENTILLVPPVIQALVTFGIALVFIIIGATLFFAATGTTLETLGEAQFTPDMIAMIALLFFIFLFLMLFIVAYFQAGFFGMVRETVCKRKTSMKSFGKEARKHYLNYVGYSIITSLVTLLIATPMIASIWVFIAGAANRPNTTSLIIGGLFLLGLIILLVLGIIWGFGIFFATPALIFHATDGVDAIKYSFRFAKDHFVEALVTFAISIGISVGASVVLNIITVPVDIAADLLQSTILNYLSGFLSVIIIFVQIIVTTILAVFLFRIYKAVAKPPTN